MHNSNLQNPKGCDYIKITPTHQVLYFQNEFSGGSGLPENFKFDDSKYKGELSKKAKSRLKDAINWFCELTNEVKQINVDGKNIIFRQTFITLTLPSKQVHSDIDIKSKLFNHFLTELRQKHSLKNYVWRAEKQKNSNIHFHLACDIGLHYEDLRNMWNRICEKLGYVSRYRENIIKKGKEDYIQYMLSLGHDVKKALEFWNEHLKGVSVPNSTDIHRVKSVKSMAAYINGYMTKESSGEKIKGRIWYISKSLARMNWSFPISINERDILLSSGVDVKESDNCKIILESPGKLKERGIYFVDELFQYVKELVKGVREGVEVDEIFNQIEKKFYPEIVKEINNNNDLIIQRELWQVN